MSELAKESVKRIMEAPVAGLAKLSDSQFDLVLAMIFAARLCNPVEIKREVKRPTKAGR